MLSTSHIALFVLISIRTGPCLDDEQQSIAGVAFLSLPRVLKTTYHIFHVVCTSACNDDHEGLLFSDLTLSYSIAMIRYDTNR